MCLRTGTLSETEAPKYTRTRTGAAPDLLVEFGVRRSLVNEQFDDMLIALPCSQVERVAALIVGDVGQGLVA